MKNQRTWLAGLCIWVLVAACSPVGPSNEKIRLDLEDLIKQQTRGIAAVANLEMKRKVLSEDRVKVQMTASYKTDQEELRKASIAVQTLRTRPFGGMGAFELGKAVDTARQLDGKTEKFTFVYRLEGNGVWKIAQIFDG